MTRSDKIKLIRAGIPKRIIPFKLAAYAEFWDAMTKFNNDEEKALQAIKPESKRILEKFFFPTPEQIAANELDKAKYAKYHE